MAFDLLGFWQDGLLNRWMSIRPLALVSGRMPACPWAWFRRCQVGHSLVRRTGSATFLEAGQTSCSSVMRMRICTYNPKGGVGKSTLAVSIAVELFRRGRNVLLGDADDQRTALTWAVTAGEAGYAVPTTIGLHAGFHRPGQLPAGYEDVVIDLPGRSAGVCRAGLMISDLALVPIQVGSIETWALSRVLETLEEARGFHPELRTLLVLNRDNPRTSMARSTRELLLEQGLPLARTSLAHRVGYIESIAAGMGPTTYAPGSAAAKEISALVDELQEMKNGDIEAA